MRLGKMRQPYYRIVVADSRTKRDGRVIETIGKYHPTEEPSFMQVDPDRVAYWLGVGAQPTGPVTAILKVTGDWQRFRGLPAPEPMRTRSPRADKREVFQAASRAAAGVADRPATTQRGRGGGKGAAEPAAGSPSGTPAGAAAPAPEQPAVAPGAAGQSVAGAPGE
jgi:small subunit ribosomal protein S16